MNLTIQPLTEQPQNRNIQLSLKTARQVNWLQPNVLRIFETVQQVRTRGLTYSFQVKKTSIYDSHQVFYHNQVGHSFEF